MVDFFPAVFDSISVLLTAEPVLYIVSIIGLALVLRAIGALTSAG